MLPQLPKDKANHVIYGIVIFLVFSVLLNPIGGLGAAIFLGALKETYDLVTGKGYAHSLDFVATAAGGLLGFLCTRLS